MTDISRTGRVIQNAKIAIFFYCIVLVMQFFSRKIFLDYLGAELLGLNTTAQNLLQFLNLAESGIGAAISFSLYKPLSVGNRQEIINIVSLQGWLYRRVGLLVICGSLVLMIFFPYIFAKAHISLVYAYGIFIAFLISALLGYFVNYKTIVLTADQKEYKITIETQSIKVAKIFLQMLAIVALPHGYVYWILLEVLAAIITSIRLSYCVSREYPWLRSNISNIKEIASQYEFILKKTKQLLFHKIAGYVLSQTTPLVIFSYTSLSMVAIYGNYLVVMGGCLLFVDAVFKGFSASVGNLVAEGNVERIKKVFWKVMTIKLCIAGGVCSGLLFLSQSFIELWVGTEYILPNDALVIMILMYFVQMTRTCDMFISAYGLFQDIWAPVVESILNLGLSLLGGYYWGLSGILLGVLISQIIIVNGWKVYFLYSQGFQESVWKFICLYTRKVLSLLVIVGLQYFCFLKSFPLVFGNFSAWVVNAFMVVGSYIFISSIVFYSIDTDFRETVRQFLKRLIY